MASLAINGGSRAAESLRYPSWPILGDEERRLVGEVLESRQWGRLGGPKTDEFEQAFAAYQGAKHGIAVANGTVALELALLAIGVRPLDEVIVPAVTFVASATAVVRVGAIAVFVDSDPESVVISPEAFEAAITDRTTAAICVHLAGYPCDMDAILSIAERRGVAIVEDCAHAHGTQWRGKGVGSLGAASGFSFQASKSLTCGEGGAVLTDDDAVAERARLIHQVGRKQGRPGNEYYIVSSGYRMTEFQSAVGLGQLARLPQQVLHRQAAGDFLAAELAKIGGLTALKRDPRVTRRGYYYFQLKYDAEQFRGVPRDRFVEALRAEGVPCGAGHGAPLYRQPAFRRAELERFYARGVKLPDYEAMHLPVAERLCSEWQVTIPHPVLLADRSSLQSILEAVVKIKEHAEELL